MNERRGGKQYVPEIISGGFAEFLYPRKFHPPSFPDVARPDRASRLVTIFCCGPASALFSVWN